MFRLIRLILLVLAAALPLRAQEVPVAGLPDWVEPLELPDFPAALYAHVLPLINYENRQCGLRATKTAMMEGGVIKSDAVRHPLEPLHPATRTGLLELAHEMKPLALRWGK